VALVAAAALPWARYGGIEVRLYEIPGWPWFLAAAVAQQAAVLVTVSGPARRWRAVPAAFGLASGAVTAGLAVVTIVASHDPARVFGPVIPLVEPWLAAGGVAAVAAAMAGATASVIAGFLVLGQSRDGPGR
jgi:hypothetical protein